MRVITIEPETLETFRASWPCNGLQDVDHIVLAEHDGDLVALDYCDSNDEPLETPIDSGAATSALVDDAIKNAKGSPCVPGLIMDTVWNY